MLVPSKFTRLEESTIFKMKSILQVRFEEELVKSAYLRSRESFKDASEFIYALDALFVLGMIELDECSETIKYA